MKYVFSNKNVKTESFIELCNLVRDYGYAGFEVYDSSKEKSEHKDSIFKSVARVGSKRKLINRHISVSALKFPEEITAQTNPDMLVKQVDYAVRSASENVIVQIANDTPNDVIVEKLTPAIQSAENLGVKILVETVGKYANTQNALDLINLFTTTVIGVCWDVRETYFVAKESADKSIQTLGAYINYVRIGDKIGDKKVLIGEGELPVIDFVRALKSLNYDGFVCAGWNDEYTSYDIVLTHFINYMTKITKGKRQTKPVYYNRSKTGTFPWKKYEVMDLTFSEVLDEMVERYPDQYAFKYTTLDYTRTYSEFREDVDNVARALVSMGVQPGHHVAIWATNVPEWFLTFWASVKIGAVLVTVNTAYKIHETEYLLRQSDTHTLVMIDSCKDSNYKEIMEELCPELKNTKPGSPLYSKKLPFLRNVITVGFNMDGCLEWKDMLKRSNLVPKEEILRRVPEQVKQKYQSKKKRNLMITWILTFGGMLFLVN